MHVTADFVHSNDAPHPHEAADFHTGISDLHAGPHSPPGRPPPTAPRAPAERPGVLASVQGLGGQGGGVASGEEGWARTVPSGDVTTPSRRANLPRLQVEGWAGARRASQYEGSEFPENEGGGFPEHLRRPSVDNPSAFDQSGQMLGARTLSHTPPRMRASPTAFLAGVWGLPS